MKKADMDDEVKKKQAAQGLEELTGALAKTGDPELIREFFNCLFTQSELHDIANRWLLVKEIKRGTPQREIAKLFGISLCKITRGSRMLKLENSAFERMFKSAGLF